VVEESTADRRDLLVAQPTFPIDGNLKVPATISLTAATHSLLLYCYNSKIRITKRIPARFNIPLSQCGMKLGFGNFVPPGVDTTYQRTQPIPSFDTIILPLKFDRVERLEVRWDSTPCVANCAKIWIKEESVYFAPPSAAVWKLFGCCCF
jgi:hypothetical protein